MKNIKISLKLLMILSFVLLLSVIFNTNTVNAMTEDEAQEILELLPDEITLDLKESEYEKATSIIEPKIKSIIESNNIDTSEIEIYCEIPDYFSKEKFYYCTIYINNETTGSSLGNKDIKLIYNNHDQYNSADENYVNNLDVGSPCVYAIDIDNLKDESIDICTCIENYYESKFNNSSIKVIATSGEMDCWGGSMNILIFKNDVMYRFEYVGAKFIIPVITVPESETDIIEYAKNVCINSEYFEDFKNFEKIEKGLSEFLAQKIENDLYNTINTDEIYMLYYTDTYGNECDVDIIIKQQKEIEVTEETTNIKLETDTAIVPEDTKLVVEEVENGNTYTLVENTLKNEISKMYVYNISLESNGVKVQPSGKVTISIPIPKDFDKSKLAIFRIEDDGTKIEYEVTVKDNYATFETDHFSTYVLAQKAEEEKNVETTNTTGTTETEQTTTNTEHKKDETPKTGTENNAMSVISSILSIISIVGLAVVKRI